MVESEGEGVSNIPETIKRQKCAAVGLRKYCSASRLMERVFQVLSFLAEEDFILAKDSMVSDWLFTFFSVNLPLNLRLYGRNW